MGIMSEHWHRKRQEEAEANGFPDFGDDIPSQGVLHRTQEAYIEYGEYVNSYRLIPGVDGLIPVDRRILLSAPTEFKPTISTVARTMEFYHPHGDASINPSKLVRQGLLLGSGAHGSTEHLLNIQHAAPRYTKTMRQKGRMADLIYRHLPFVETYNNELGTDEPKAIPLPIPHCLSRGHMGIGVGLSARYPAFSAKSLMVAQHKNHWKYLRAPDGLKINVQNSELEKLWEEGTGRIEYQFDVEWDEKDQGVWIRGDASLFKPRMKLKRLVEYIEDGKIEISDASDEFMALKMKRTKRTKVINNEQLFDLARQISTLKRKYSLVVCMPDATVQSISLRDWLKMSKANYEEAFAAWKENQIEVIELRIALAELLPDVAVMLQDNKRDSTILNALKARGLNEAILEKIKAKPLRLLRKTDFSKEIANLEAGKKIVQSDTPDKLLKQCYS